MRVLTLTLTDDNGKNRKTLTYTPQFLEKETNQTEIIVISEF